MRARDRALALAELAGLTPSAPAYLPFVDAAEREMGGHACVVVALGMCEHCGGMRQPTTPVRIEQPTTGGVSHHDAWRCAGCGAVTFSNQASRVEWPHLTGGDNNA
jgi:hypothetical protein